MSLSFKQHRRCQQPAANVASLLPPQGPDPQQPLAVAPQVIAAMPSQSESEGTTISAMAAPPVLPPLSLPPASMEANDAAPIATEKADDEDDFTKRLRSGVEFDSPETSTCNVPATHPQAHPLSPRKLFPSMDDLSVSSSAGGLLFPSPTADDATFPLPPSAFGPDISDPLAPNANPEFSSFLFSPL